MYRIRLVDAIDAVRVTDDYGQSLAIASGKPRSIKPGLIFTAALGSPEAGGEWKCHEPLDLVWKLIVATTFAQQVIEEAASRDLARTRGSEEMRAAGTVACGFYMASGATDAEARAIVRRNLGREWESC